MPLLLLSLDDTLLDRAGAFRAWASDFLVRVGAPEYDLDWLLAVDADGMGSTWDVAEAVKERYGLREAAIDLVEEIRGELMGRVRLDRYLADWVISEDVGVRKPNPRIFAIAAERARMRLGGAWLIGDSPEADIGGAAGVGMRSVWLHRGRRWAEPRYAPTRTADGVIAAIAEVMASR